MDTGNDNLPVLSEEHGWQLETSILLHIKMLEMNEEKFKGLFIIYQVS